MIQSHVQTYIGIDPGMSGGLAKIYPSGVSADSMPKTEHDIWDWFDIGGSKMAIIEKVGGYVGGGEGDKGGGRANGSAMFKFGTSYGGLRMALIAAGIPFEEIAPQTWQKALKITKAKDEAKTQWKNRLKARAQQLFPQLTVTLATADAILIACYCQRKTEGRL